MNKTILDLLKQEYEGKTISVFFVEVFKERWQRHDFGVYWLNKPNNLEYEDKVTEQTITVIDVISENAVHNLKCDYYYLIWNNSQDDNVFIN